MEGFVTIRNQKVIANPQTAPAHPMDDLEYQDGGETFKPLTAEEAQALRKQNPPISPWRVLAVQGLVGMVVALVAWLVSGKASAGWSAGYGALAVVIPGAAFARGLTSRLTSINPATAIAGVLVWELVKITLTVAILIAAPRLVEGLSWPAMLVSMVVTMQVYWAALWLAPNKRLTDNA
jgi:ATP synthase protein I